MQMTRNACLFNEPGSQIYKDAKALRKIITLRKVEVEQGKYVPPPAATSGKGSERIRYVLSLVDCLEYISGKFGLCHWVTMVKQMGHL